ncbi:MAG: Lrp/AsnC family transcriptional regulator [Candidatus Woesearchaeota archaeon]|nr:Lrp/AsnC family transcriptional regulator [Candidatus Woesearchaeota archaeon]
MLEKNETRIIEELKENSRASVREIAKATGMRPSTVHLKIKKMKEEGVIEKFTVKLSNAKSGENFIAFLLVKTNKEIRNNLFQNPRIKEVFGITGEYDLLIKMKFSDIDEFNRFLISFRKTEGVEGTVSLVSTINIKEEI